MIIGTYGTPPGYGGSSSANRYSSIDDLLVQLPDNTANAIAAKDVRDSIFTLWERISDVQTTASQSASASSVYTNLSPSVASNLAGIPAGSTFSGANMQEMWDKLLYPYVYPYASLLGGNTREFGSPNTVNLYTRSTITETANIYRVKIKVMDIYHNHMNPVNRFYEIFTISTRSPRLLNAFTLYPTKVIKWLKNCR